MVNMVSTELPDVASEYDPRGVRLPAVGIRGLRLPLQILKGKQEVQTVTAEVEIGIAIEAQQRGAHMSRVVEELYRWAASARSPRDVRSLLKAMADRNGTAYVSARIRFDYFLPQSAPVTALFGLLDIPVVWELLWQEGRLHSRTQFTFPMLTLCPCSKAVSEYGAHNQRSYLRLWLEAEEGLPLLPDPYLPMVNEVASVPVYPLLKRVDEKYITERAYENPRFVEDVVRETVLLLQHRKELTWFRIECESIESIHNHNVFACYEKPREER